MLTHRLLSETAFVQSQESAGTLPESVADGLIGELAAEMGSRRRYEIAKLKTTTDELLRSVSFLRELPAEDFQVLAGRLRPQTAVAREVIFHEGDAGDALYIIARGVVRISKREGSESRHLATLMAGNFFGEAAILDHRPRNATVTAISPCAFYRLSRKDLELLSEVYPNIRRALEEENKRRQLQNATVS